MFTGFFFCVKQENFTVLPSPPLDSTRRRNRRCCLGLYHLITTHVRQLQRLEATAPLLPMVAATAVTRCPITRWVSLHRCSTRGGRGSGGWAGVQRGHNRRIWPPTPATPFPQDGDTCEEVLRRVAAGGCGEGFAAPQLRGWRLPLLLLLLLLRVGRR